MMTERSQHKKQNRKMKPRNIIDFDCIMNKVCLNGIRWVIRYDTKQITGVKSLSCLWWITWFGIINNEIQCSILI